MSAHETLNGSVTQFITVRFYKKGGKTDCSNYWTMSLLSAWYKILSDIILSRLSPYVNEIIGDHQCEFQRNRWVADQIICIRQILEKKWERTDTVHQLFIDFKKVKIQLGGVSIKFCKIVN
jgi:predicted NAD-dependent protein-ADP-ribosyltransferase YbiA (DUF1768 family)